MTSGWSTGVDIHKLKSREAPAFDRYARTRGGWASSLARQDDTLFLASGYWGVQAIPLR